MRNSFSVINPSVMVGGSSFDSQLESIICRKDHYLMMMVSGSSFDSELERIICRKDCVRDTKTSVASSLFC